MVLTRQSGDLLDVFVSRVRVGRRRGKREGAEVLVVRKIRFIFRLVESASKGAPGDVVW